MTKTRAKKGEPVQLTRTQKAQGSKERRVPSSIHRYRAQIVALKQNNKSLATALDEARQDYRLLQDENLLLREERQQLLERVAKLQKGDRDGSRTALEVKPAVAFLCETIQDIEALHQKVQLAKRNIKGVLYPVEHTQSTETLSPIIDDSEASTRGKVHFEISKELTDRGPSNAVYPKTPHPLCISSTDSHPCFASTPVDNVTDSQSISMQFTPGAIRFSECETSSGSNAHSQITSSNKQQNVSPLEANQHPSNGSSPGLPESGGREDSESQKEGVAEHLDSTADSDVHRPKRRCRSLSVSYQEPNLTKKLRRGDPFTTRMTDWSPSDNRRKSKKKKAISVSKKILQQRRVFLQDLTNKM